MDIQQSLGARTLIYYLYRNTLLGVILLIVSFVIGTINPDIGLISSALMVLSFFIIIVGAIRGWIKYVSCTFVLGEYALIIRRGILSKRETSIPYRQIQNVDISQSFSNRMMGVSKLVILTAGHDDNDNTGESEGIFDVIQSSVASELQEELLKRTNIQQIKQAA